jgi:hypothetical protein
MHKLKNKKSEYILLLLILLGVIFYFVSYKNKKVSEKIEIKKQEITNSQNNINQKEKNNIAEDNNDGETKKPDEDKIPDKVFIKVPFTSQAPFAIWDEKHEEACEEASLIMIKYYLDKKALNKDIAEKEIQDMIKFEIKKYGDYKDSDAGETMKLADDFYGIKNLKVIYNFKAEDIKKYLAKNNPIIIPAAGRELGNPNFTAPGPLYHNLVLVGYEGNTIITNDPGTRKGEGYKYDVEVLYKAIHDFPGRPRDILNGRKAMIIIQ